LSRFRNFYRRIAAPSHHENVSKSFLDDGDLRCNVRETNTMSSINQKSVVRPLWVKNHMKQEIANRLIVCSTQGNSFIILGATCIAVKDRESKEWVEDHYAIGERVSLVPTSRTRSQLRAWRLTIFSFGSRIEIGTILSVSSLSSEDWDDLRRSDRFGRLLGTSLGNEYEYDGASPKYCGRERYKGMDATNQIFY
jgi:hypothetical protein